jgi:hypothetical protein
VSAMPPREVAGWAESRFHVDAFPSLPASGVAPPRFIKPCQPTLADKSPSGPQYGAGLPFIRQLPQHL